MDDSTRNEAPNSRDGTKLMALNVDRVELREPTSWKGIFGGTDGWSGGQGADAEIYG